MTVFHAEQTMQSKSMVLFIFSYYKLIMWVLSLSGTCIYTALNECQTSEICQNGGQCTDLERGYSCTCTDGYSGTNCEIRGIKKNYSYSL